MPTAACNIPWIESPFFQLELEQSDLSAADKERVLRYASDGYLVIDTGIDHSVCDRIIHQLHGQFSKAQQKHAGNHHDSHRLLDAWRYNDAVRSVAADQKNMALLYGRILKAYRAVTTTPITKHR
ncbi:hypothetical protein SAMN05444008_106189 [Cnuella takakiae]|uniref:Phytanoyl-CoA dioxygenase (PhyH) n=1 Tax=Cnuella takakiae TaxID=1302690 RepID=A0A1M5AAQ9_9BACT|nr:hypothetical protein [Cnuella takakiae]OLY92029.1 hypothetical protein BUE76_09065 [Cnuella takakiae]SHF27400.1 hypothetical protein SAMN05444008_106189 [Cnuella takakiae]